MATLESLQAKIAKLQAQAEAIVKKDSTAVIAKIRELMEKHGLTTTDIDAHVNGGKKRARKPGVAAAAKPSNSAAKYRDPKTGATWTGHGRAPAWISSAKDRSKFLVEGKAVVLAPAGKKVAKAGNYVRGPQAPKYRDPKSGATWSGRGPAPAWLAGAKDRTKFLIAGAGEDTAEPRFVAAATKAPAKKSVTKKVAAKKSGVAAKKVSAKTSASRKSPEKKGTAKKAVAAASNKSPVEKPPQKGVTAAAPVAAIESGAELTT